MTQRNEMKAARSAHERRTRQSQEASSTTRISRLRRRGAMVTFSVVAAAGFAAAYIVPTATAFAGSNGDETVASGAGSTQYSEAQSDAKTFVADDAAVTAKIKRDGYTTYVEPEPEPEPEPVVQAASAGGGQAAPAPSYSGGGSPSDWMAAAGISPSDYGYVDYVVSRESSWNPNATNASSGACGLVQALPCSKVPGGGYDPVANLRWANDYAVGRYGSWAGAYNFWVANSWW